MLKQYLTTPLVRILLSAVIAVQLVACGSGGDSSAGVTALPAATTGAGTTDIVDDIVLTGSVGDGPVTGATVEIWSARGNLIDTTRTDNTASFRFRFRIRRSHYPLLLKVTGGTDLVTGAAPDFQLLSVMPDRHTRTVMINPLTTLIVRIAQFLPGSVTPDNIRTAGKMVMDTLGFGIDPAVIADPVSTRITDANIAGLVKSSEVMGEMIRRTRDQIAATGREVNGDAVMAAIAADMRDGRVDGQGGEGTDPGTTAVVKVVSAQVLVEALSNTLRVGGLIATGVIDQAIATTRPGITSDGLTQHVRITDQMLQQTRTALAAAAVVDPSAEVAALETVVSRLSAGVLPDEVANSLPADASRSLDNAVLLSSTADPAQIDAVNAMEQTATAETGAGQKTTDPVITDPAPTDPVTTDPAPIDPVITDPAPTDPVTTDPVTTDPAPIDPVTTDPAPTDPVTTDPVSTPAPINTAPVIGGTPATSVTAGTAYNFQPVASDADGDPLHYSISGKPAWASFDTLTGHLGGTPGDSDTGSYGNIVIAVSDGTDTAMLQAFSIRVDPAQAQAPAAGSFTLTWTAPVARADGAPLSLSEIGGYHIRYGTTAGSYPNTVDVSDGSAQSATVNNLVPGTYHVVMTSYDNSGRESAYSPEVIKIAQ